MLKRLFDIIFSCIGLIIVIPFMLMISILIKREDCGAIFYKGIRVGRHGKKFKILKFRTMVMDAENIGASSTPDDDYRITKIGKFLRKYKIDELPQLFNVFLGEMSFVGPRPQIPWAVELFSEEEKKILLNLRPGITDYASLKFSNEGEILKSSKDPDKDYMEKIHPEKMRLSLEYARKASVKEDLKIMIKTLFILFKKRR